MECEHSGPKSPVTGLCGRCIDRKNHELPELRKYLMRVTRFAEDDESMHRYCPCHGEWAFGGRDGSRIAGHHRVDE